jgi:RNA polymerase sigma-70 factor (ECF subfamily)
MGMAQQSGKPDQRDGPPATLGDVIYAGGSKAAETEQHWVGLVERIAAGEQLALHALYERSHRMVYTLIVRITGNRETAEELTLDVFHDIWRRAAGYDAGSGTVLGWIMNQARSRAIDQVRFEQRKKRVDPQAGDSLAATEAATAQDNLEIKQQNQALQAALRGLAPAERQAIGASYFADLTHAEAAVRLGEPLGTIKTRIRSGLQKLRQTLAGDGGKS